MGERRACAETEKRDKGKAKMTKRERKRGNIRGRMCVYTYARVVHNVVHNVVHK